jgi:hypothetical protein
MQLNQQITFLSDGSDTVRYLQLYMSPEAEHILDWHHLTMRLTVLDQYAKGLVHHDRELGEEIREKMARLKWALWYRNGETIATGFVESTVNQVVSKRFCKKQQMQWSKRGAHLLLQTRVKTLNRELCAVFKRWYPDLEVEDLAEAA